MTYKVLVHLSPKKKKKKKRKPAVKHLAELLKKGGQHGVEDKR